MAGHELPPLSQASPGPWKLASGAACGQICSLRRSHYFARTPARVPCSLSSIIIFRHVPITITSGFHFYFIIYILVKNLLIVIGSRITVICDSIDINKLFREVNCGISVSRTFLLVILINFIEF